MKQGYMQNWAAMATEMQRPFQAMWDLNRKTLENFNFLRLEDLSRTNGDLFDKQMHLAIDNSHKLLDYMEKTFKIMEHSFLMFSKDLNENTRRTLTSSRENFLQNNLMSPEEIMAFLKRSEGMTKSKGKRLSAKSSQSSSMKKSATPAKRKSKSHVSSSKSESSSKRNASTAKSKRSKLAASSKSSSANKKISASASIKKQAKPKSSASKASAKKKNISKNTTSAGMHAKNSMLENKPSMQQSKLNLNNQKPIESSKNNSPTHHAVQGLNSFQGKDKHF